MNLILTLDYELFGDGSGDVFKHMIEPTNRILEICEKNNIKITIFFELIEYIKLKEEWDRGNTMGYQENPIKAMDDQLQQAALDGHDIQLHIHPQWINAQWENNAWQVDKSNWRLGDFTTGSAYRIKDLIKEGKSTLEAIIQKVLPDYRCTALRAGAYNIMPSDKVYEAMLDLGFKIDSSVYLGGYEDTTLSRFDYRGVPLNLDFWWADAQDIRLEDNKNKLIMEIPIFALPQARWKKVLNFNKIKSLLTKGKKSVSALAQEKISNKSLVAKVKFMMSKEAQTWDFCMFSKSQHKRYFRYIERQTDRNSFVLIGHPKSFVKDNSLVNMIKLAQKSKVKYSFKTLLRAYGGFCE